MRRAVTKTDVAHGESLEDWTLFSIRIKSVSNMDIFLAALDTKQSFR